MNSDNRRTLSHFDSRGTSDSYPYYSDGPLRSRLTSPTVAITVVVLAVTVLYRAAFHQRLLPNLHSLPHILCDALVFGIPARWLFALERFINPPLFPTEMLRSQPATRAAKREAFERIVNHVSSTGDKGTGVRGRMTSPDQPPGLGNLDNSCYQNSILQSLASLDQFTSYLSTCSDVRRPYISRTQTLDALLELLNKLSDPSSNGWTFWTPTPLKNMSTWQQQDAQEYYSKLLDQIDIEAARVLPGPGDSPEDQRDADGYDGYSSIFDSDQDSGYHSPANHVKSGWEPGLARNPLQGLVAQRVACVNCGYCEGLTMIPFNCLTLTLDNSPEDDLYERMEQHTKVEAIQGVECPKCTLIMCRDAVKALVERTGGNPAMCARLQAVEEALAEEAFDDATLTEKCKITPKARVSSTKTKQVALARPPQSLVFHFNRSGFDETTGLMYKNTAAVRFPKFLDMAPWCLGSAAKPTTLPERVIYPSDIEQWTLDPRASMVSGERQPSRLSGPIYELRAVVTHYGLHENGHYVCYRRHTSAPPPIAGKNSTAADGALTDAFEEGSADDDTDMDIEMSGALDSEEANGSALGQDQDEAPEARWWRLSDDNVTQVDEATVLGQGGVFMLFYDCVDPDRVRVRKASKPVVTADTAAQGTTNNTLGEGQDSMVASTESGEGIQTNGGRPSSTPPTPWSSGAAGAAVPNGPNGHSASNDAKKGEQNGVPVGGSLEPGHDRGADSTIRKDDEGSPSQPPPDNGPGSETFAAPA